MSLFIILTVAIIETITTMFLAAKYAVQVKHHYDEDYKPKYYVNEWMVLFVGCFLGGPGLLLSYFVMPQIRTEDSLNGFRFLWISLALSILQAAVVTLLVYLKILYVTF